MTLTIGILALQGAFAKHAEAMKSLGVTARYVRRPEELQDCQGLIIPGGESTTMIKQMDFMGLQQPIKEFAQEYPVFGTCAGMILMAKRVLDGSVEPLGLLDISVERNAYGRQTESFSTEIMSSKGPLHAVFIRAPQLIDYAEAVEVLAEWEAVPIWLQQGKHMVASFHPELSANSLIHSHFLELCRLKERVFV